MAYTIKASLGDKTVYRDSYIYKDKDELLYDQIMQDKNRISPGSKFFVYEGEFYEIVEDKMMEALSRVHDAKQRRSIKSRFEQKQKDHLRLEKVFAGDLQNDCCMVKDDYAIEMINQGAYKFRVPEKCLPQNVWINTYSTVPALYIGYLKDTSGLFKDCPDNYTFINVLINFRMSNYNTHIGYYFDQKKEWLLSDHLTYFRVILFEKWEKYMEEHELEYDKDFLQKMEIKPVTSRHDIIDLD